MLIRYYSKKDINKIEYLGSLLHDNYKFNLDIYSKCLVVEINEIVIGYIVYSIIYERAEIVDIVIDSSYRNNNYGYNLLDYSIKDIKLNNCNNITLEVSSLNIPAINLYKKFDFKIRSVRHNYYGNIDAYLMKKDLE